MGAYTTVQSGRKVVQWMWGNLKPSLPADTVLWHLKYMTHSTILQVLQNHVGATSSTTDIKIYIAWSSATLKQATQKEHL